MTRVCLCCCPWQCQVGWQKEEIWPRLAQTPAILLENIFASLVHNGVCDWKANPLSQLDKLTPYVSKDGLCVVSFKSILTERYHSPSSWSVCLLGMICCSLTLIPALRGELSRHQVIPLMSFMSLKSFPCLYDAPTGEICWEECCEFCGNIFFIVDIFTSII